MDKLLALHYNIRTVHFFDNNGVDRCFYFSDKMLANDIFIEFYTKEDMELGEEEEIDEEDDEIDEEEVDEEDEFENNADFPEYGSQLTVLMKHKSRYYLFTMYDNTSEIGIPIMLLQTVVFVVKLIEETKPDDLVEYLTSISTAPLIPHLIPDPEFRTLAKRLIKDKIQIIHELIQEGKTGLN